MKPEHHKEVWSVYTGKIKRSTLNGKYKTLYDEAKEVGGILYVVEDQRYE